MKVVRVSKPPSQRSAVKDISAEGQLQCTGLSTVAELNPNLAKNVLTWAVMYGAAIHSGKAMNFSGPGCLVAIRTQSRGGARSFGSVQQIKIPCQSDIQPVG